MKNSNRKQPNNLILVVIFALCVLFLIAVSLIVKFIGVLGESTYDGSHRYTLLLSDSSEHVVYITVDPSINHRGKLIVENAESVGDALDQLPIAVDGVIVTSTEFDPEDSVASLLQTAFIKRNEIRYNLTFVDLIRIYIATRTSFDEQNTYTIKLPFEETGSISLDTVFRDQTIIEEGMTVSIENATEISGLGGSLETVLTTMGAEVISVETAVSEKQKSVITYFGEESYTLRKFETLLGYPVSLDERMGISDISIIIGKDGLNNAVFGSVEEVLIEE